MAPQYDQERKYTIISEEMFDYMRGRIVDLSHQLASVQELNTNLSRQRNAMAGDLSKLNSHHHELIDLKLNFKKEVDKARIQQRQQDAKVYKKFKQEAENWKAKYMQVNSQYKPVYDALVYYMNTGDPLPLINRANELKNR